MIKVYFESNSHAELVATFESEEVYALCISALENNAKSKGMILTESVEEENEKFARKCSITSEGINKGYVIGDGDFYIKDDSALAEKYILENTKYKDIYDAYADEFYYWTEWEDEDDYQYEMINGVLNEIE